MFAINKKQLLVATMSVCATISLVGCGSADVADKTNTVTKQGTIDVETMTVGIPEQSLQKAVFSFTLDDTPIAHTGGKNQYMARNKLKDGAVVLAQCKNGKCFQLQRLYRETPISKEDGEAAMKTMLPKDAPPQSKVDDKQLSDSKIKMPVVEYIFGDEYYGTITYTNGKDNQVFAVTVDKPSVLKEGAAASGEETKPAQ
ncbi:MAG: hypothetical protein SFY67_15465 [Candidatus Melainabacteria bacterium]|nr:hypothetical protein [Candidatus Melainabacteria bacterium]